MSDPTTQAQIVAGQNKDLIRKLIQDELRHVTGVTPGGPYQSVAVDQYGRVTWASTLSTSGAIVHRTGSAQSIPDNTETIVQWQNTYALDIDQGGYFSTLANTKLTVPATGYYTAACGILWASNSTGVRTVRMTYYTGSIDDYVDGVKENAASGDNTYQVFVYPMIYLLSGYYMKVAVKQTSGGALDLNVRSWFSLVRL